MPPPPHQRDTLGTVECPPTGITAPRRPGRCTSRDRDDRMPQPVIRAMGILRRPPPWPIATSASCRPTSPT